MLASTLIKHHMGENQGEIQMTERRYFLPQNYTITWCTYKTKITKHFFYNRIAYYLLLLFVGLMLYCFTSARKKVTKKDESPGELTCT